MVIFDINTERNVNVTVTEKVYQGDNRISQFHTNLPSVIGDEKHDVSTCTCEMRCYILDDDYISYNIPTASLSYKTDITIDVTEKAQSVPVMFIFEKDGVIVAKTKKVSFSVSAAPPKDRNPLTPREQFDRIINEQRETIAEQAETITEQEGTISSQGEQITELSGEVTELTTENTRLETLTDTQRKTIQNMLDNPPQPKLYTPPVVTPSGSVQQISPPAGYDGLSNVTVAPVIIPEIRLQNKLVDPTSNTQLIESDEGYDGLSSVSVTGISYMNINLQKWVSPNLDDEPFELIFETTVRSYIAYGQTKMIKATILTATNIGDYAFSNCTGLQSVVLPVPLLTIGSGAFQGCSSLTEINFPNSLTSINTLAFFNCSSLTEINFPNSLTSISANALLNCSKLTDLTLAQGFNCNGLNVSYSTRFTAETIVACLEALADRTGQTAYTITFGGTNLNKLTDEQKAIAISKNWNLA